LEKNTVNDRCKKAKQFFNVANEYELIGKNPFAKLPGSVKANREKFYFVTCEETERLLDTAPDMEWRLLLALCRYGGLRSPSETMIIRWQNVNWQMVVFSPKTEHHEGRESRIVPIFPELRPYLEEAWDNAPPERVWRHVIGFSKLPEPDPWYFKLGIAYPRRATIEGTGMGAVRRCEFSTGAFVEPVTVWDPPRRLAFDVESQPPPMHELSPYRHVHPPHLDGYLRCQRGEFRLVALPGGRTRLEGST